MASVCWPLNHLSTRASASSPSCPQTANHVRALLTSCLWSVLTNYSNFIFFLVMWENSNVYYGICWSFLAKHDASVIAFLFQLRCVSLTPVRMEACASRTAWTLTASAQKASVDVSVMLVNKYSTFHLFSQPPPKNGNWNFSLLNWENLNRMVKPFLIWMTGCKCHNLD